MMDENAYFPFGEGSRQCIAFRLGWMMAVLSKYNIELLTTGDEISFDPNALTTLPGEQINIKLQAREKSSE